MINDRPHKNLTVWKRSLELVKLIYALTSTYPRGEEYGFKAQLRRAAISAPPNLTVGLSRQTSKDNLHVINIADTSLSEIDTQLEISVMLSYIDETRFSEVQQLLIPVEQLVGGLRRSIRKQ
ncbi:MAG: four helix bundle protein [Ignavibacteria bacterium]|nr:four helix bundle protein [Ignavibacteria bacterium]